MKIVIFIIVDKPRSLPTYNNLLPHCILPGTKNIFSNPDKQIMGPSLASSPKEVY
jgi:hypothetical protein